MQGRVGSDRGVPTARTRSCGHHRARLFHIPQHTQDCAMARHAAPRRPLPDLRGAQLEALHTTETVTGMPPSVFAVAAALPALLRDPLRVDLYPDHPSMSEPISYSVLISALIAERVSPTHQPTAGPHLTPQASLRPSPSTSMLPPSTAKSRPASSAPVRSSSTPSNAPRVQSRVGLEDYLASVEEYIQDLERCSALRSSRVRASLLTNQNSARRTSLGRASAHRRPWIRTCAMPCCGGRSSLLRLSLGMRWRSDCGVDGAYSIGIGSDICQRPSTTSPRASLRCASSA